ncbi:MAG: cyclase family protein, partial [Mycobacterium sp.]
MASTPRVLPGYDELPVAPGKPPGSSWGLWGEDDVWGCLNLLTSERLLEATRTVSKGAVFNLNLELELPDPPLFGRSAFTHNVTGGDAGFGHDDELTDWNTQSSSQWDGFRHIRNPVHGFYNGVEDASHGVHHWARRGIAGRAVVADVQRWRESTGRPLEMNVRDPIEPSDVLSTLSSQGVDVVPGDILLIRTGWVHWYRSLSQAERAGLGTSMATPGLTSGEETARMLWDLHVAAVAADNPALEVWPPAFLASREAFDAVRGDISQVVDQFVHMRLLP